MIALALQEEAFVVCIHDDYCSHVEATEISRILSKISKLVSNSYRGTLQEANELHNIPQ